MKNLKKGRFLIKKSHDGLIRINGFCKNSFLCIVILLTLMAISCLSGPSAGGIRKIVTNFQGSTPIEQCARIWTGYATQVIGVNGTMSPLRYITQNQGEVIIIPPGQSTLNVNVFDGYGDNPRYPGLELKFEAKAGAVYILSTENPRFRTTVEISIKELDVMTEQDIYPHDKLYISDKEALKQHINDAIANKK